MNDYTILREIGKGGMGCVYEAVDSKRNRIALKMMSAKAAAYPDYHDMFRQEVQALRSLNNPSIVRIMDEPFSDADGNLFLPMELVEGQTIAHIVQENGPYNEEQAIDIFCKLLDAFTYIHDNHCIHRDVKPSNIMIRQDGSICVIDFGIAKDSKTSTGKTIGRIVGTDGYMSPEQAKGYNIDTRTDIYSLGCLLHFMLTGKHAISKQSNDYDTICVILENDFPRVADEGIAVSGRTQRAILKAVDKNMTLRFQTAEEFKCALCNEVVTVGRYDCDVNIADNYVSGHHLDILWQPVSKENEAFYVTIRDHSKNGTGINGIKILNNDFCFLVDRSLNSLVKDTTVLPQVLIAGLPQCTLDWQEVVAVLYEKINGVRPVPANGMFNRERGTLGLLTQDGTANIPAGYAILCFVVPIIGWIKGFHWRKEKPEKAKSVMLFAWLGVAFYVVIAFIANILT